LELLDLPPATGARNPEHVRGCGLDSADPTTPANPAAGFALRKAAGDRSSPRRSVLDPTFSNLTCHRLEVHCYITILIFNLITACLPEAGGILGQARRHP